MKEKFTYHVGLLAKDRDPEFSELPFGETEHLNKLANSMMKASEAGHIDLLQVKISENVYEYYYTKKGK